MNPAKRYLRYILFLGGFFTIVFSFTWILDLTPSRLAGISWLESLFGRISPLSTDTEVGILWLISGVFMALAGSRASIHRPRLETVGFLFAILMPLLMGAIFFASWMLGTSQNGYITTISYSMFTVPYFAYLFMAGDDFQCPPEEVDHD